MPKPHYPFGGDWTSEKLERVRKYLVAYATIMSKQSFRFAYIDAFAGSGYRSKKGRTEQAQSLLPEFDEADSRDFMDGSARIALQISPRFDKYIFIERDPNRFRQLKKLRDEFPLLREDIILENVDANSYLKDLCDNRSWSSRRAVLFSRSLWNAGNMGHHHGHCSHRSDRSLAVISAWSCCQQAD